MKKERKELSSLKADKPRPPKKSKKDIEAHQWWREMNIEYLKDNDI